MKLLWFSCLWEWYFAKVLLKDLLCATEFVETFMKKMRNLSLFLGVFWSNILESSISKFPIQGLPSIHIEISWWLQHPKYLPLTILITYRQLLQAIASDWVWGLWVKSIILGLWVNQRFFSPLFSNISGREIRKFPYGNSRSPKSTGNGK